MKILQLTKKFPFPLRDGESIAVHYLSKALDQLGCEMSLLSMNTTKHYFDMNELPVTYDHYEEISTIEVDNRVKITDAFLNLFSRDSYHVSRFVSHSFRHRLIQLLENNDYDIILLETLYLTPYVKYIRAHSDAKIVMRSHNLEYEIWERMLKNMSLSLAKIYLMYLVKKLRSYELRNLNVYDYLITVTQRDLSNFVKLGYKKKGMVVPIGIDLRDYHLKELNKNENLRLSFIGSLDWMPNMEGISWFLEKVWNAYPEKRTGVQLHIAGRNTPKPFYNQANEDLIIHGEVEDAVAFISSCQLMIVPLFSGSGMRVKILEAMALGRVVLTTSLGLEGVAARHGEQVLIANTAFDFIDQLNYCKNNPKAMISIGKAARKLIGEKYDNLSNAKKLYDSLKILKENK